MFGATVACCKNAIDFVDSQTVVYPAGASLVLYNMGLHSQNIITGTDRTRPVTALAVTPNRRFVAVAEQALASEAVGSDYQPVITVYDITVWTDNFIRLLDLYHTVFFRIWR